MMKIVYCANAFTISITTIKTVTLNTGKTNLFKQRGFFFLFYGF